MRKKRSNIVKNLYFIVLVDLFLTILPYLSNANNLFKFHEVLMGTVVEIILIGDDYYKAEQAVSEAFKEIKWIEKLMSPWIEDGDVFKLNLHAGKKWLNASMDTLYVIKKSVEISEHTNGAFDITVRPLIHLWQKAREKGCPPSVDEVRSFLNLVNFKNILISKDGKILFKREGMSIDLGGIAKGYAVDKAFELLKMLGYKNLIVNTGGDLRVGGLKFGKPWTIGIRDPRNSEKLIAKISLSDSALATSGDYEKFFIYQGKRYHHIINPKDGFPADGCKSVSVIAKEGILADAMATAIFVLDPEEGYKLCQNTRELDCLIIDNYGKIIITPSLKEKISLLN